MFCLYACFRTTPEKTIFDLAGEAAPIAEQLGQTS